MISVYIKGGLEEASTFLKSLKVTWMKILFKKDIKENIWKVFALAESLGGYESLIEHP